MNDRNGGCDKKKSDSQENKLEESELSASIFSYFPTSLISDAGQKERYQRGKTPHTIFTWWARRPFAAARGILLAAVLDRDKTTAKSFQEYFTTQGLHAHGARVLDPFGGGATIPLEAARQGAEVTTVDNNELAIFLQRALLEYSQLGDIANAVERYGKALLDDLGRETESFYPARHGDGTHRTIAYLWSTELGCPQCRASLSLLRRPWLSRRGSRRTFVHRAWDPSQKRYSIEIRQNGEPQKDASAWQKRFVTCPGCSHKVHRKELSALAPEHFTDVLIARCTSDGRYSGTPKRYHHPEEVPFWPGDHLLQKELQADLDKIGASLPEAELPRWSGVTNPALYGLARHVDLLSLRQQATLVRLARLIHEHFPRWEANEGHQRALGIAAFLSALIDQLVDWNSRLATWLAPNEQVGRALSGPGIAMVWDYVEIDPLQEAPANLYDKLERITTGLREIPTFRFPPRVVRGDARNLPFEDRHFDLVITDPPYFDNLFYSVLADCIYVWKRLALQPFFPDDFLAPSTDRSRELTMNRHLHGDRAAASNYFQEGMEVALTEIRRVLKPRGIVAMVFAHATVEGWAAMVAAFRGAGLNLKVAWPMYVERKHRPRGVASRAINTSFVLVATSLSSAPREASPLCWTHFEENIFHPLATAILTPSEDPDTADDYGPLTLGRTLFGKAVAAYSENYPLIDEESGLLGDREALERISTLVDQLLGDQSFGVRRP